MNLRIETSHRSKTKATVWNGPMLAATFWHEKTGQVDAKVEAICTSAELRAIADELDKWGAAK